MTKEQLIEILSGILKIPALTKKEQLEHLAIEQVIEMLEVER